MDDREIYNLAWEFRDKIMKAKALGVFATGCCFNDFPRKCCREASYLLAEFFETKGIETLYVWGDDKESQSHGWLVLNDERIKEPIKKLKTFHR